MTVGAEVVRPFVPARQQRALAEREVLGGFAEVAARGDQHLADLALVGYVVADQEVLGDLLGDGRAALRPARIREIADECADQATLVDTMMLEETLVLRRHECAPHLFRDGIERDADAPLRRLVYFGERTAVA